MSIQDDITVSRDEIAALMETIQDTPQTRSREYTTGAARDVIRYDLVAARTVGRGQLPTLDLVHERFGALMAETFGRLTGQPASVLCMPAEPIKYVECASALASPVCIQVLDLTGLRGTGVFTVDPSLLFHLIDLLLGGSPTKVVDASEILRRRGMTAVERRLFDHVVRTLGKDLTRAWDGVAPLAIKPVRVETEIKHVAIFEPSEMVVDTMFEVEVAGCRGEVHLILPQSALRPIEKKLTSGLLDANEDEATSWAAPLTALMREVTVQVTAELGSSTVSLRELMALKVGDIVRLDRDPESPIVLFVEGTPKLFGTPTLSHGNIAVEVSGATQPKEKRQ